MTFRFFTNQNAKTWQQFFAEINLLAIIDILVKKLFLKRSSLKKFQFREKNYQLLNEEILQNSLTYDWKLFYYLRENQKSCKTNLTNVYK